MVPTIILKEKNSEENLEVDFRLFSIPAFIKWIWIMGSNTIKISIKAGNDADDNKLNKTDFNKITLCYASSNHRC